jgi:CsoR family transcriptional regulator, copper-sensing transcriptional repressor
MISLIQERVLVSNDTTSQDKKDILNRLNRLEGQIKGIKHMIEENRSCTDVLTQVAAVRAAANKLGSIILGNYCNNCMLEVFDQKDSDKVKNDILQTLQKFISFLD